MNSNVKKLSIVCLLIFALLLFSTTLIQFFSEKELNDNAWNSRNIYKEFSVQRGSILVENTPIAYSEKSDDAFGFQRIYPDNELFAPITGFFSISNRADRGVEGALNSVLNGDESKNAVLSLSDFFSGRAKTGVNVNLTVNRVAQIAAMHALQSANASGAIVAVEPKTGKIIALASTPAINPNDFAVHNTTEASNAFSTAAQMEDSPLKNKALTETYPPGSTYKLVTSSIAIEHLGLNSDSEVDSPQKYLLPGTNTFLPNYHDGNCQSDGKTSLINALVISCNTTFAILGNAVGNKNMEEQSEKFGVGEKWILAGEGSSIPYISAPSVFPKNATADKLAMDSIGQGDDQMTVLQMALISSAIANNGVLMKPQIVSSFSDQNGTIKSFNSQSWGVPITSRTAQELTKMMVKTVNDFSTKAKVGGIEVAGKSGTAENQENAAPHAWFTGFAPADNPEIAIAVFVKNGGTGSSAAAPKAAEVIKAYLAQIGRL